MATALAQGQNVTYKHFDCGTHIGHATEDFKNTINALHIDSHKAKSHAARAVLSKQAGTPINIDTYFHVITKTKSAGTITNTMATAQAKALNDAYNPYNIFFKLKGVDYTVNDAWAVANGTDMTALKKVLRKGTYSTLNLYFHTDLVGSILGTCTLPANMGTNPAAYVGDGCNIQANTMPGGNVLG
ncbi:hypothetical protein LTR28_000354, partial [Elasticomyces elasticus]